MSIMDIFTIGSLIFGIFVIIGGIYALYYEKRKCPERKTGYILVFVIYLLGILLIVGAITGYNVIGLACIFLIIFFHLYYKKKYLSSDSDI